MRRIYLNQNECLIENEKIIIEGETYHYLKNVLRAKEGYSFSGFDGSGKEYIVEISKVGKNFLEAVILKKMGRYDVETPFDLYLFQSIPKSKKIEKIIEGTVQLGIKGIYPVISKRTVVNIPEDKVENKIKRWKKISEEASKVSGRIVIPEVFPVIKFEEAIKIKKDIGFIFWEGERKILRDVIGEKINFSPMNKRIHIFIGPEGGFDEEEIILAKNNNFFISSLGKRILKVEIASIVATALTIYEIEKISHIFHPSLRKR